MDEECEESNGLEERNIEDAFEEKANEKKEVEVEEKQVFPSCEDSVRKEDAGVSEKPTVELSGTVDSLSVTNKVENSTETNRSDPVYENGKRKIKEEKPSTKVVVRRLPPFMTKEIFLEQVSPIPQCDYMYFVNGDPSYGIYSYSRAYMNFVNQEDVFTFTRTFDNYVFLDSKGQEYPAIVEFSPFQRVPKQRSKKKDTLTGTIESDPMYLSFKENLLAEALENSKPGAKTMKQHYFETEISTTEEISTTPLLEFLKQRRAEKARIRDERREEKKRKEAERKLKQKAKDKKIDGEEEETAKEVKIDHCTVSAEKKNNKGEFTLLLKSEKEKIAEKIIIPDDKERNTNLNNRLSTKESVLFRDKITIKKRKEKSIDNNDPTMALSENSSNIARNYRKPHIESNVEYSFNRQNAPLSHNFDYEKNRTSLYEMVTNNSQIREDICGLKKAEQQTQYLRKILGLSSQDNQTPPTDLDGMKSVHVKRSISLSHDKSLCSLTSDNNEKQTKHEPKILVSSHKTLWCDRNINPALPSASFKTSTNLTKTKNETDSKSAYNSTFSEEHKINKKGDSSVESSQVNRPFRGEIVIDRALSTNNVLPSAFRKIESKDQTRD